jgi:1,4-alpha-glucan branching enzyme
MTSIRDDGSVEFRFYRPHAGDVKLAGDFSHWVRHAVSMQPAGGGWWIASLSLPPGDYRFRYVVDGYWFTDFASHGIEICENGWNSVLVVPEKKVRLTITTTKQTIAKSVA